MSRHILVLTILAVLSGAFVVGAAEKKPDLKKPEAPPAVQPLGRTVAMIFKIPNGELPSMEVFCATDRYAMQTQFEGAKGFANIDVSGTVHALQGRTDRLLVTWQALVDFEGNDGSIHASSMGSAEIKPGGSARMMTIAGKSLMVEIREVREVE